VDELHRNSQPKTWQVDFMAGYVSKHLSVQYFNDHMLDELLLL